jgi:hypothetical protein
VTAERVGPGAVVLVKWGREEVEMRVERKNDDGTFYSVANKFDANVRPEQVIRIVGWERA